MPRKSVKENKSIYQIAREELEYSREKVEELLFAKISSDRLGKLENGKLQFRPEEIIWLSEIYSKPDLCNYYCSHDCEIGKEYVPEIKIKDLSQIVLEMLSSLNNVQEKQKRLIDITVDGKIDDEEIKDFIEIQRELEKISITVESLQLWTEKMLTSGAINKDKYERIKNSETL
jgi:hypothetical protein